jgi:nicotinamidase-related amidase
MMARQDRIAAEPYDWPIHGSLTVQNTALVVIDMQRDCTFSHLVRRQQTWHAKVCEEGGYLSHQGYDISSTRQIIPAIQALLSAVRSSGLPIFHTREGHRADLSDLPTRELLRSRNNASGIGIGDQGPLGRLLVRGEAGHDIIHEVYPRVGEPIVDKPGKGAFTNTDFDLLLRVKGVKNLIICGVTTDVCVHTTMREANDRGYDCLLVEDCCAASEAALHSAAVEMVKTEGGIFGATAKCKQVLEGLGQA